MGKTAGLVLLGLLLAAACSSEPACVPGRQLACLCSDGSTGAHRCSAQGELGFGSFLALDAAAGNLIGAQFHEVAGSKSTLLRSFDVSARSIRSERDLPGEYGDLHLRFDRLSSRAVLGFRVPFTSNASPMYRVELHESLSAALSCSISRMS